MKLRNSNARMQCRWTHKVRRITEKRTGCAPAIPSPSASGPIATSCGEPTSRPNRCRQATGRRRTRRCSKAGTIARNDIEIDQALHAAIKSDNFDFDGFGKRIAKLGLPADIAVIGETLPSEYLDFAWENLWWDKVADGKRPDPTGRVVNARVRADKRAAMEAEGQGAAGTGGRHRGDPGQPAGQHQEEPGGYDGGPAGSPGRRQTSGWVEDEQA